MTHRPIYPLLLLLAAGCSGHGKPNPSAGSGVQLTPAASPSTFWTALVNATESGGTLVKSGGQPNLADAGAHSLQSILSGDGDFELTATDPQPFRFVGLGHPHDDLSSSAIDFAFRLQAGRADIYQAGAWQADNTVLAGDQLRIAVSSGVVSFYKNGALLYTSTTPPSYPLVAYAVLIDPGATVSGAQMSSASAPGADFVSNLAATSSSGGTGATVTWSTAVPADGQVEYGPTNAYGAWSVYAASPCLDHSIALDGLLPGTSYHYRVRSEDAGGNAVLSADAVFTTGGATTAIGNHHRFCGWLMATGYVSIDQDPYYADFVAHADDFDAVHPVWYTITSPTTYKSDFGEGAPQVLAHTTAGGQRTLLIPTLTATGGSEPGWVSQMIHDPSLRAQHEAAVVNLVTSKNYDGIDLDYEHLADSDRDAFSTFAEELAPKLHAAGKTLSFAVGALTSSKFGFWDYDRLSAAADQLHVMGYDYHGIGSPHPGPVAPLGWIEQVIGYIQTIGGGTRASKFILGLPNYGVAAPENSSVGYWCQSLDCMNTVGGNYDVTTDHMNSCSLTNGVPTAAGRAPNVAAMSQGHLYFDDIASHEEKVIAAAQAGLGGITYWTIGGEPDRPGPLTWFQMVRSHFPK
ncbi:MAG TPA: glycosyl hydrolase family 18 protein [Polyangia bacterium]